MVWRRTTAVWVAIGMLVSLSFVPSSDSELETECMHSTLSDAVYEYTCNEQSWEESDETVPVEISTVTDSDMGEVTIDTDLTSTTAERSGGTTYLNTSDDEARWERDDDTVTIHRNGLIVEAIHSEVVPAGYQNYNSTENTTIAIVYSEPVEDPCEGVSYWETYLFDTEPDEERVSPERELVVNTTSWYTHQYNDNPDWEFWEHKKEEGVVGNPIVNNGVHAWDFDAPPGPRADAFKIQYEAFVEGVSKDKQTFVIEAQLDCR